jgi:hypothetical protein
LDLDGQASGALQPTFCNTNLPAVQDMINLKKRLKQSGAVTYPSPWPGCCQVIVLPDPVINKVLTPSSAFCVFGPPHSRSSSCGL